MSVYYLCLPRIESAQEGIATVSTMVSTTKSVDNKRNRSPNYTDLEIQLLFDLAEKYKKVIENPKTDANANREKSNAWLKLTNEFNTKAKTPYSRSTESLQNCYRLQKRKMKRMKKLTPATGSVDNQQSLDSQQSMDSFEGVEQDWNDDSDRTGSPPNIPEVIVSEVKKEYDVYEYECEIDISKTGAGVPATQPKENVEIKTEVDLATDGMDTMKDCESDFMQEKQLLPPPEERRQPIEVINEIPKVKVKEFARKTFKRKIYDSPEGSNSNKVSNRRRPKNDSPSFKELAQKKIELVEIQKEIWRLDLEEKIKQIKHNDELRALEMKIKEDEMEAREKIKLLEIQKEIFTVDLKEKIQQSKHNDEIRALEIKIKEEELKALNLKFDLIEKTDTY